MKFTDDLIDATRVSLDDLIDESGVSARTIQRWVARRRLPKPTRATGTGAGRGGTVSWDISVLRLVRDLALAENLTRSLRRDPLGTVRLIHNRDYVIVDCTLHDPTNRKP